MADEITPDMRRNVMLNALYGVQPSTIPLEFSAANGFLPTDIGNVGQYTNIVQDWLQPEVLNMILAANQLGQVAPPAPTGRMSLEAILESTDGNSWEAVLAQALLDGASPSQAIEQTLNFFDEFASDMIPADTEQWRKDIAGKAETWFQGLVDDSVNAASSAMQNDFLGLNSMSDEFDAGELNPFLPAALEMMDSARADALSGMKDDRLAAIDSRMGDTDAYRAAAEKAYLDSLSEYDREQYERQLRDTEIERALLGNSNAVASVLDPDSESYKALMEQASQIMTQEDWLANYEADGMPYGEEWRTGDFWALPKNREDAVARVRRDMEDEFRDLNNVPVGMQPTPITRKETTTPLVDVFNSETNRDLSKARNNAAGMDYALSGETQKKVDAARSANDSAMAEAARALALEDTLRKYGVTPQSRRVNRFLSGGQALFGS